MTDDPHSPTPPPGSLRSPIRPSTPASVDSPPAPIATPPAPPAPGAARDTSPQDSQHALALVRQKVEALVNEYAQGGINRAQFSALYQRYSDQRAIIEKLMERNPDNEAWRQVVSNRGQTGFLRARLEAQPLYYGVYAANTFSPLFAGGSLEAAVDFPRDAMLRAVWNMPNRPPIGLGRKSLAADQWLVLAVGGKAATLVVFSLEPSKTQAQLLRDLHLDFERANQMAFERGWLAADRLVFPQRALFEHEP